MFSANALSREQFCSLEGAFAKTVQKREKRGGEVNGEAAPAIAGYQYVRPLGVGGFARVYLYEQNSPRRPVAIKVLERRYHGEQWVKQFRREADMMASIAAHPAVVPIYETGVTAGGESYIAMEYCPHSLGHTSRQEPLPLKTVLETGVRLAGALESAHRQGILHRDIKPGNILVNAAGKPVLTDFGIAEWNMRGMGTEIFTLTIPWTAPEILCGHTRGSVASEIWALAATLYTLASGRKPFEGKQRRNEDGPESKGYSFEQLSAHPMVKEIQKGVYRPLSRQEHMTRMPHTNYEALDSVLALAMEKAPEKRYASMRDFGSDLRRLQQFYGFEMTEMELVLQEWEGPVQPGAKRFTPNLAVSSTGYVPRADRTPKTHTAFSGSPDGSRPKSAPASRFRLIALTALLTSGLLIGTYALARLWGLL